MWGELEGAVVGLTYSKEGNEGCKFTEGPTGASLPRPERKSKKL